MLVLEQLNNLVGVDVYHANFVRIDSCISQVSPNKLNALTSFCSSSFRDRKSLKDEATRVALAKMTVALLPQSIGLLKSILEERKVALDFECHFSLFCYLDEVQWYSRLQPCAHEVLLYVREYLLQIEENIANAAWMAADLIGDHWLPDDALPVLVEIVKHAKTSDGRIAGLHGLEKLHERSKTERADEIIRKTLARVLDQDNSQDVKEYASKIYSRFYGELET